MTRQEKYPETDTFHYFNANPKNRITTDCITRAICTALEMPYTQVVMEMAKMQCESGYDDGDSKLVDMYLKSKGWVKCKQPRKYNNTKYTGSEWCRHCKNHEFVCMDRMVANIGGNHTVAIIDYQVWDIWDSTDGCIGNYWVKA